MTALFRSLVVLLLVVIPLVSVLAQEECDPRTDYNLEADAALQRGEFEETIAAATCGLEMNPGDGSLYGTRGIAYYYSGDYTNAIPDLIQTDMLLPQNAYVHYFLGMAYYFTEKNREAVEHFTATLEFAPNTPDGDSLLPDTYAYRAWAQFSLERYDEAIGDFKRALELTPDMIVALSGRGAAYANLRQYQAAVTDFDRLVELFPEAADQYFEIGKVTVVIGEYAGLVADVSALNVSIELNPNYTEGYRLRGIAHLQLGELDEAMADLTEAVERDPDDAEAYYQRGRVHYINEVYESALEDYSRAIEIDPDNPDYYFSRASAYQDLHDYENAIADSTRQIELQPDDEGGYLMRGFSYTLNGEAADGAADFLEWADRIETDAIDGGTLTIGEVESIEMGEGKVFRFQFEGEAGQRLQLSAVSAIPDFSIDSLIIVLSPDGTPLVGQDDDIPFEGINDQDFDLDATITDFEVPENGTYTLVVTHAGGNSEGAVNVLVEPSPDVANPT